MNLLSLLSIPDSVPTQTQAGRELILTVSSYINGEINTIRGNADKMQAREENMESPHLKDQLHKILPVVNRQGSDSAMLDNTLEFLVMSGMDLPLAVMITIPEPWSNNQTLSQEIRDFYQYYATMMEPWDGPASIVFSDGDLLGAVLDRNGLRPSRYYVMKNGDVDPGFRGGSSPCTGRGDRSEGKTSSGKNAPGRYSKRQDLKRCGDQGGRMPTLSLTASGWTAT